MIDNPEQEPPVAAHHIDVVADGEDDGPIDVHKNPVTGVEPLGTHEEGQVVNVADEVDHAVHLGGPEN